MFLLYIHTYVCTVLYYTIRLSTRQLYNNKSHLTLRYTTLHYATPQRRNSIISLSFFLSFFLLSSKRRQRDLTLHIIDINIIKFIIKINRSSHRLSLHDHRPLGDSER